MEYNFKSIEKKWQNKWEKAKIFEVKKNKKRKYYVLEMWPYPSASGLHMGHAFNYIIGDIYARFKRMQGFNVLYPMGYDSFGLPAENAAIKAKSHPKKFTEDAIRNFIKQQKSLGLSYDWSRMIEAHKPDYYKWDQWIFLKMFEKGLVYRKEAPVNFCPKCNTVLANEQVHNGKCWRHEDTDVEIKYLKQWFFKITAYADELYENIDTLTGWPEDVKVMQKNWIGKSYGTEIFFEVNGETWNVFTTRPDTIYGVTFMVISAQHPELFKIVTKKQKEKVKEFLKKIKSTKKEDVEKEKEGVFTGSYALNPLTKEKIPIYVGNFVVADYGSGMVMAVPAHDQRDFEFAKKYNLPIKVVVQPSNAKFNQEKMEKAYEEDGKLVNSGKFTGMESNKARVVITEFLIRKGLGKKAINYKLKDWLISRQRFWGTPIPIIYCNRCGIVPVPEKELPVKLPENIKLTTRENPLKKCKKFIEVKCPKCKGKARRETDTMDTFVNSSWYFLRYCDPRNKKEIFNKKKVSYWMPIDIYIGGKEHACMHLIYFRFYTKFLRDLGLFEKKIDEPVINLFNQGMVHGEDGTVMSKSRGNVILPEEISDKYGIDTARLFLVSIASPKKDIQWNEEGIKGAFKFIKKIFNYFKSVKIGEVDEKTENKLNGTIKNVTNNIENLDYNLAIIKIRKFFDSLPEETSKNVLENFLKLLHPFCPHITEEIWEKLHKHNSNSTKFLSLEKWPKAGKINEKLLKEEKLIEKLIEDINNIFNILKKKEEKVKKIYIYSTPNEKKIFINNKDLINKKIGLDIEIFAVNEKNIYDPKNFAKKAKPEKPALYFE